MAMSFQIIQDKLERPYEVSTERRKLPPQDVQTQCQNGYFLKHYLRFPKMQNLFRRAALGVSFCIKYFPSCFVCYHSTAI